MENRPTETLRARVWARRTLGMVSVAAAALWALSSLLAVMFATAGWVHVAGCLAFLTGAILFLTDYAASSRADREPGFTASIVAVCGLLAFGLGWIAVDPSGWGFKAADAPGVNRAA